MVKMYADTLPYIRAIEVLVQDAFPGRKVKVWVEQAMFRDDMGVVQARVGPYGAYVTFSAFDPVYEQEIASALIGMLQDRMRKEGGEDHD